MRGVLPTILARTEGMALAFPLLVLETWSVHRVHNESGEMNHRQLLCFLANTSSGKL